MIVCWPAKISDKGGCAASPHSSTSCRRLLESPALQAPDILNGIPQKPIDGVSLAYTFADAGRGRRKTAGVRDGRQSRHVPERLDCFLGSPSLPWQPGPYRLDIDKAKWSCTTSTRTSRRPTTSPRKNPTSCGRCRTLVGGSRPQQLLPLDWRG